jgi:hypothetical protein
MFVWALQAAINIGPEWVSWVAALVFVLAMGSVGFRAWKAKDVVWTDDMKDAQRRHGMETLLKMPSVLLLGLSSLIPSSLVRAGVLPQPAAALLFFIMLVGSIWLWRVLVRRKA